ncbi:uncharacterized protein LOC112048269 [Bicyclus anynana]|uniref:Uncharacterized protein LOC112048269 n=1 Tax=Bicyclus anynana TaxID=110368 RepID=A0A6J1N927_BICAN|nr:uncharacterized protein LOC112048269 [Bicyclus anynana]
MKFLIIFTAALTLTSADKRCTGVNIDNKYYNLNIIKDGINHVHDLVVNRNDNSIYFTYESVAQNAPNRVLAHIDIGTKVATVIDGIRNATAIAIDNFNNKVYVGGGDGLFKINEHKVPERLPIHDDVMSMHFKNGLYFVNRRKEAYKFEDGFASLVPELKGIKVDRLVIDDDKNIFFTEDRKLYRIKLDTRAVNTHERHLAYYITTDIYSKAYLCTDKGLYAYNKYKFVFDKIGELRNLKALSFHRMNDPVYAVADYIVKLSLSPIGCFDD